MILPGLRAALRHLTVLPVPYDDADRRAPAAAALAWFPVVGLLLGAALFAVLSLPLPVLPRAALALAAWVALTGGLHEDGLMDCADAAFAVASRERRLEILKDPRAGAHAVSAAVLLLVLRFAALAAVSPAAVLVAPVIGRWWMAVSLARWRPARATGLGAAFAAGARPFAPTLITLGLLAALAPMGGAMRTTLAFALAIIFGAVTAAFLARRFGGLTGDAHGAAGLLAELAALFAFIPITMEGA
ncbi:MAG TPA: adenosylcobinamide-GDP ribazoletransferase [Longimicrobiales bacterium]